MLKTLNLLSKSKRCEREYQHRQIAQPAEMSEPAGLSSRKEATSNGNCRRVKMRLAFRTERTITYRGDRRRNVALRRHQDRWKVWKLVSYSTEQTSSRIRVRECMKLWPVQLLVGIGLCLMASPIFAQGEGPSSEAFQLVSVGGVPSDWTHRHVIFSSSNVKTDLSSLRNEPRYWLQQLQRRGSQDTNSVEALDASAIATAQLSTMDERFVGDGEINENRGRDHRVGRKKRLHHDWNQSLGVSVSSVLEYPAKFSFTSSNPSPSCTNDFVVVTQPGGGASFPGTFNVIGFNNLYVSTAGGTQFCSGTAPKAIFEYNASTAAGAMNGAPTLSLDGTLIAFVETASAANGGAVFHVLKWHSGDVQNVESAFPTAFNTSALPNCATNGAAAPCEYSLQYTSATANRTAPFVDYGSDTAYVTDDGGKLYAITPVFQATPAIPPAVAAGWPVNVVSGVALVAPVYDSVSENVFVGSILGTEFFVKTAGSTTGSCSTGVTPCLGSNNFSFGASSAIGDPTIVDSSSGRIFFSGRRTGATPGTFVVQTDTQISAASAVTGTVGTVGTATAFGGQPDNNYYTSVSSGKFYVCGVDTNSDAQLFAFGFNGAGVMNPTGVGGPLQLGNVASTNASCSTDLTEVFNQSGATDWLFAGLGGRCAGAAAGTTGCVMSLNITSGFPTAVSGTLIETNASSGIIVDNETDVSASSITTDIYFHVTGPQSCPDYLGTAHSATCLVSATQSGLQ